MAVVTDPVCGEELEESQAAAQIVYQEVAYSFCSENCRQTFQANPDDYVSPESTSSTT